MPFVFEEPSVSGFVFEDEPIDPREAEIAAHEARGGGILPALERGLRRTGQTLAAVTDIGIGEAPIPEGFEVESGLAQALTEAGRTTPLPGRGVKVLEQERAIQALPQHPTLTRMAQAAGAEEGIFDAIAAAGGEFMESPDKLSFVAETLAEQVPVFGTFLAGTKGLGTAMGGTQTLTKQAATLGGAGAFSSIAATYGPNVAEGLQKGLEFNDAEARALKQSAAQAVIDGATAAVLPFKIGPNQYTNVPAQALIQASGGAGGEMARSGVVGEEAEMGDVVIEGMLELLGLPVEAVQAAVLRPGAAPEVPVTPEPTPEPTVVDVFTEQLAEQGRQRQAEIEATIPARPEGPTVPKRTFEQTYRTGGVAAPWTETEITPRAKPSLVEILGLPAPQQMGQAPIPVEPTSFGQLPPAEAARFVFEDEFTGQRKAEPTVTPKTETRITPTDRRVVEAPIAEEQRVAERRKFPTPTEVAAAEFETKAGELELTDIQKEALAPVVDADPVTGFHPAKDRVPTVERAQEHVTETGEPAVYIETDIANLGGLNAELGHSGADKVFRGITDIFQAELDALNTDSVKIRHGGDEFSAIVINTDQQSVNEAMDRAQAKVADYVAEQGLADLPHTKAGAPPGVGIKYGTSEIVPGLTSEEIFSEADLQVEFQKKQEKADVTPEKIEEVRPGPLERPTGEVAERVAEEVKPVAEEERVTERAVTIPDDLEVTMDVETIETGTTVQETFNAKELMKSIDDGIDAYTKLKKCLG